MQCAAFLSGMVNSKLIDRALVLAPKTLLDQWARELKVSFQPTMRPGLVSSVVNSAVRVTKNSSRAAHVR